MDVTISTVPMIVDFAVPAMLRVAVLHPHVTLHYRPEFRMVDLDAETGATLALRAGAMPHGDGLCVTPLGTLDFALYASPGYLARCGADVPLAGHVFVSHDRPMDLAPWERWLAAHVPGRRDALRTNDDNAARMAIKAGVGIGFMPIASLIYSPELVELMGPQPEWQTQLWLVGRHAALQDATLAAVHETIARTMRSSLM